MRVLITGGRGFVGRQVAREAGDRGHEVTTADLGAPISETDIELDVLDGQAVAECVAGHDVVIHVRRLWGRFRRGQNRLKPFVSMLWVRRISWRLPGTTGNGLFICLRPPSTGCDRI